MMDKTKSLGLHHGANHGLSLKVRGRLVFFNHSYFHPLSCLVSWERVILALDSLLLLHRYLVYDIMGDISTVLLG